MEFQKGDRVRCLNSLGYEDQLTEGKRYSVINIVLGQSPVFDKILIVDDRGEKNWFCEGRFVKVEERRAA